MPVRRLRVRKELGWALTKWSCGEVMLGQPRPDDVGFRSQCLSYVFKYVTTKNLCIFFFLLFTYFY